MVNLEQDERGVILRGEAQAGARRHVILGAHDGMLRVAVTAAAEKGKANRAIVEVLSEVLGVSKSAIELLSGETSTRKRFLIGVNVKKIRAALARITSEK